jgi:hypothetical protein
MHFDRVRFRWIGLGLLLGLVVLASAGTVNSATSPSAEDDSRVGRLAVQEPLPAVAAAVHQGVSPSVVLSTTSPATIFVPIVYRDYKQPLAPLCRYGVVAFGGQTKWLPTWRAGWTLDFGAHAPPAGIAAEFAQVIRVRQNKDGCTYLDGYTISPALTEDGLGALIRQAPGAIWMIGNEPDRGPNPEDCQRGAQDDIYPEVYARAYHDVYHFIKQHDPTALVANAGLVQVTPGRLQYLDKMWQEYQTRYGTPMPVDIWNMHLYILPELMPNGQPNGIASIALGTDPALGMRESGGDSNRCSDPQVYCYAEHDNLTIFAQQVVAMRTWMKAHGQQHKPLILSEYSILWPYIIDPGGGCFLQDEYGNCFTPERVNSFMTRTFDYLETSADPALGYPLDDNRLVQRWMWFSAYFAPGAPMSSLLTPSLAELSEVGRHFREEVNRRLGYVNLLPSAVGGSIGHIDASRGTATVSLYVDILNNGNIAVSAPIRATFYADSSLRVPIGTATTTPEMRSCAVRATRVSVTWSGLSTGTHSFWVKVDSTSAIYEANEADNVAEGAVTVYQYGTYLPIMHR